MARPLAAQQTAAIVRGPACLLQGSLNRRLSRWCTTWASNWMPSVSALLQSEYSLVCPLNNTFCNLLLRIITFLWINELFLVRITFLLSSDDGLNRQLCGGITMGHLQLMLRARYPSMIFEDWHSTNWLRNLQYTSSKKSFLLLQVIMALTQCYAPCELPMGPVGPGRPTKDYSQPLHVDCSVEYELPNAAKPPAGAKSEPLLMIHPCYYRRVDSQRRPFVNNLPRAMPTRRQRPQPYPVRSVDHTAASARPDTVMAFLWRDNKRDPLLCGGDFSSGSDSGISVGHWTDPERSPLAPLPDSGVPTPDEKRPCPPPCPCGKPLEDPMPRYSHVQLQQWLQNVQVSISPAPRRRPHIMRCAVPPLLIH